MSLDWKTFKSALGSPSNRVFYIDDEGSKIPIDSECEFQEALRLARLNKNRLRLVYECDKLKPNEMMRTDQYQSVHQVTNSVEKCVECKMRNAIAVSENLNRDENSCSCGGDSPPEWFTLYMKKFKKDLIHELKSYIHDEVHSPENVKSKTIGELFHMGNEKLFSSTSAHTKKKKKVSEKDSTDLTDQRQIKPPKKPSGTKPDRLELLDQKTKALPKEKRRLLESKHHEKLKAHRNSLGAQKGCYTRPTERDIFCETAFNEYSAMFYQDNVSLTVAEDEEFTVSTFIKNIGTNQWMSPSLECVMACSVTLNENSKPLPKLGPGENCYVAITGKITPRTFLQSYSGSFKCRVAEGRNCYISREFVGNIHVKKTLPDLPSPFSFLFSDSEKIVEENIEEIEKTLQNISLLQPKVSGKEENAKNPVLLINLPKGAEQRLAEEVKNDPVGMPAGSGVSNLTRNQTELYEKVKKDGEFESSDSDLSILFMSEEEGEEDTFFVVPSESLSFAESASEGKKSPVAAEPTINSRTSTEQTTTVKQKPVKPTAKNGMQRERNVFSENVRTSPRFSSFFEEEISKPKKMKSKSTKYRFTAANLTQPTFTQIPGFFEGRPSRFTFTAEKEKSEDVKRNVPQTDALGRVIYAVNRNGWCLPVKDLFERKDEHSEGSRSQGHDERQNERLKDVPAVNVLPNALINGASNVASLAFNTAKSVINNLQSAFVTEGKTEMGQPAYKEDKVKVSTEAMFKLYEMGYLNIERNRILLLLHNNDVNKVIDELVRINENSSDGPQ